MVRQTPMSLLYKDAALAFDDFQSTDHVYSMLYDLDDTYVFRCESYTLNFSVDHGQRVIMSCHQTFVFDPSLRIRNR